MCKNALFLHVEEMEKSILDPGSYPDQFQNPIDWSLAEDLSFHKNWFKSISNFLRYPDRQMDTVSQYLRATSLAHWR